VKFSNFSLLALIAAAAFALNGCGTSSSSITDTAAKSYLVELPTPAGWARQTNYPISAGVSADFLLTGPVADSATPNVLVITSATSGIALDSAAKLQTRSMAKYVDFVLDSSKAIVAKGQSAWLIQARWTTNAGHPIIFREIFFVYKSKDCQLAFTRGIGDSKNAATLLALESQIVLN
jgi:hypothetical protein